MRWISCAKCTIMYVCEEMCPFVTPWEFKHILCCCHYPKHLFWSSSLEMTKKK